MNNYGIPYSLLSNFGGLGQSTTGAGLQEILMQQWGLPRIQLPPIPAVAAAAPAKIVRVDDSNAAWLDRRVNEMRIAL